jgi:hypothetical protein
MGAKDLIKGPAVYISHGAVMPRFKPLSTMMVGCSLAIVSISMLSCTSNNDNKHTTATTLVPPPPHQVLRVVSKPQSTTSAVAALKPLDPSLNADPTKPLLRFNLENEKTFHVGEDVLIDFSVSNAKLKGDGGDFRVRYIIDDGEMKWVDKVAPFWLSGWVSGNHTIRLELIGPDDWPYRNGDANIVTREIVVEK